MEKISFVEKLILEHIKSSIVYLRGSYAQGTADEFSDIDMLVFCPDYYATDSGLSHPEESLYQIKEDYLSPEEQLKFDLTHIFEYELDYFIDKKDMDYINYVIKTKPLTYEHPKVENEKWYKKYSDTLYNKSLGIIGLGNIGKAVAGFADAFNMHVYSVRNRPGLGDNNTNSTVLGGPEEINSLLSLSDIVLLSVPKTEETYKLINKNNINYIKNGSYLVNVSRGTTMDYDAVKSALEKDKLAGFATDVFPHEPTNFLDELYKRENVLATPHVAANNSKAKLNCLDKVIENINRYKRGEEIRDKVRFDLGY